MGNHAKESPVFGAFQTFTLELSGEGLSDWTLVAEDPPDIRCITANSKRIDIELKELTHESGDRSNKQYWAFNDSARQALTSLCPDAWRHIAFLLYTPRPKYSMLSRGDVDGFRDEFLMLARALDSAWKSEWNGLGLHRISTDARSFKARFPTLSKYLGEVQVRGQCDHLGKTIYPQLISDWIMPLEQSDS